MPPQNRSLSLGRNLRGILLAAAAVVMVAGNLLSVSAASLNSASLLLSDPRTSQSGVTYTFDASGFTASAAECMVLRFNSAADGSGSVPTGISTTGASLDVTSTVITPGDWTLDATANGILEITDATGEVPGNGELVFTGITNGSTEGTTYYGLFTTYSDDTCVTAVDSVTIAYVYRDGELVELTIEPTLTFSVNSVASGVSVNGSPNTTVASGPTGINFTNDVTASTNGVSAHELDVTTNASGGYIVYTRHSGNLQNSAADTITAHTGTNASPTAFPAAGTEAWGYTTEDATLSGGTADRFTTAGNVWAGFTATNQPIADNTTATAGSETTNVAHQVGISSTTEAGTYQTTIIYTIVATY